MTIAQLRLARTEGVGPVTYRRLMSRFSTAEAALDGLPELARAGGRKEPLRIPSTRDAEREMEAVGTAGAAMVFLGTPEYPPLLATLDDAPAVLSVMGDSTLLRRKSIAVVGSRSASANGRRMAELLAADLVKVGLVVVSGLARGIDAAAHLGAIDATVACVAGGVDVAYPSENAALQKRIGQVGAVVAEMPPGTQPQSRHFPRRNRIIAGLALGVVVVEAALRSGSLITARCAGDAGRAVFAVPGSPLDARCRGANALIREGAHLTEGIEDIIGPLRLDAGTASLFAMAERPAPFAPAQLAAEDEVARAHTLVPDLLGPAPTAVDDLIRRCQLSAAAVMSVLLDLEIAGRIETLPGNRVALIAEPGG